jgi:hypothetical protein
MIPQRFTPLLGALLALLIGATPAAAADATVSRGAAPTSPLRSFPPTLPVTDGVDIATLRTGAPVARPLEEQLQLLYEAFLADAADGSTEAVDVQVNYSYALTAGSSLRAQVPVLFRPPAIFAVPGDWSPGVACSTPQDTALVCALAAAIHRWVENHTPVQGAQLSFDLLGLPQADGFTRPNLRASGLTLSLADITND